ncbi:anti-sigma factor domain-containing protein [Streptomyces sp. NPDC050529]|uniref:anti-sigma factor n=1 Tax=unclassified Streptomyces TaxID=2593676 RepID=UPI002DDBB9F8|nr:anti-sigma factor [Streptomyces sp. NBC_01022]WRZ80121.1 anti-sigma factor [Streptomyces sp. NBC_01022]
MNAVDPHDASGAYALHALPEDERLAFERHLKSCESCREEVAELQATAALLGRASAVTPPAALREEILRKVALTPQEAPARSREAPAPPRRAPVAQQPVPVTPTANGRAHAPSRQLPRLALAASVAAVLACLGVATWQYREAEDARAAARRAQEHQEEVTRVLTAPDVQVETQKLRGGGTATVAVSRSEDAATLAVSDLPRLPTGRVYEAWFIEDGTPVPAGLLSRDPGRRLTLLNGPVDNATAVALSVEPAGGSAQPTTDPLGAVELPT